MYPLPRLRVTLIVWTAAGLGSIVCWGESEGVGREAKRAVASLFLLILPFWTSRGDLERSDSQTIEVAYYPRRRPGQRQRALAGSLVLPLPLRPPLSGREVRVDRPDQGRPLQSHLRPVVASPTHPQSVVPPEPLGPDARQPTVVVTQVHQHRVEMLLEVPQAPQVLSQPMGSKLAQGKLGFRLTLGIDHPADQSHQFPTNRSTSLHRGVPNQASRLLGHSLG